MGRRAILSEETIQSMQSDRDAGIPLAQIAQKYGITPSAVQYHTKSAPREYKCTGKADWPEWKLWDALNKRYGKKGGRAVPAPPAEVGDPRPKI